MKTKIILLVSMMLVFCVNGFCEEKPNPAINLDGEWIIKSYQLDDNFNADDKEAKREVGKILKIKSGIMKIKLFNGVW